MPTDRPQSVHPLTTFRCGRQARERFPHLLCSAGVAPRNCSSEGFHFSARVDATDLWWPNLKSRITFVQRGRLCSRVRPELTLSEETIKIGPLAPQLSRRCGCHAQRNCAREGDRWDAPARRCAYGRREGSRPAQKTTSRRQSSTGKRQSMTSEVRPGVLSRRRRRPGDSPTHCVAASW